MRKAVLGILFLLAAAQPALAESPEICHAKYQVHMKSVLRNIRRMENAYVHYRWAEFKIRRMMYEQVWQARTDANDPLSRDKRAEGQDREKHLKEAVEKMRQESRRASNAFVQSLRNIEQSDANAPNICKRSDYRACLVEANRPLYSLLKEAKEEFEKIFEGERETRDAVELASGGRDGLYPDDALEPSSEHTDMFWRFESGRGQERFTADGKIMDLIYEMRKTLTWKFPGDNCCLQCN